MRVNEIAWNILRDDEISFIYLKSPFAGGIPSSLEIWTDDSNKIVLIPEEVSELFDMLESFIEEANIMVSPEKPEIKPFKQLTVTERKFEHQWCISRKDNTTICFKVGLEEQSISPLEIISNADNTTLSMSRSETEAFIDIIRDFIDKHIPVPVEPVTEELETKEPIPEEPMPEELEAEEPVPEEPMPEELEAEEPVPEEPVPEELEAEEPVPEEPVPEELETEEPKLEENEFMTEEPEEEKEEEEQLDFRW
ncbi:MAG: hypothetical protein ACFE95_11695 [Candidatus Hodarchaeota archaeon]